MQEIELTQELLKKLQMTQYEMLEELDRICRKENINYSIDGGTLLGAARDGHIIPWDDDIDIVMLREDYERFFEVCKTEMDVSRFFLQEHRTDSECNVGYARIRRKNTVYARAGHEHMKYQGGIFIDIFILDGVPDCKLLRPLHRFWCFALRKFLWAKSGWKLHESAFWRGVYRIWARIPFEWTFRRIDALARRGNKKQRDGNSGTCGFLWFDVVFYTGYAIICST